MRYEYHSDFIYSVLLSVWHFWLNLFSFHRTVCSCRVCVSYFMSFIRRNKSISVNFENKMNPKLKATFSIQMVRDRRSLMRVRAPAHRWKLRQQLTQWDIEPIPWNVSPMAEIWMNQHVSNFCFASFSMLSPTNLYWQKRVRMHTCVSNQLSVTYTHSHIRPNRTSENTNRENNTFIKMCSVIWMVIGQRDTMH